MTDKNPIIDIVNTNTGERRKVRANAFKHWQADKDSNTRGGGWIEATPEMKLDANGTANFTNKLAAAPVIPSTPPAPQKKSAVDVAIDDPTFTPEVNPPVIDPLGDTEVITDPEQVAEKPKPKRKPSPRKRK